MIGTLSLNDEVERAEDGVSLPENAMRGALSCLLPCGKEQRFASLRETRSTAACFCRKHETDHGEMLECLAYRAWMARRLAADAISPKTKGNQQ